MIPQAYLAGACALVLASGGLWTGWQAANWRRDSQALAIEKAAQKAGESATAAAVEAIKTIRVKNVTIRQATETLTREVPVYRDGTCVHDVRVQDALNQALSGPPSAGAGVSSAVRPTP